MTSREVLSRAHDASLRAMQIEQNLRSMRDRCTVGGHSGMGIAHAAILDPARHVVDLLDAEEEYSQEMRGLDDDMEDGRLLCRGSRHFVGELSAAMLEAWYVDRLPLGDMVRRFQAPRGYIMSAVEDAVGLLDGVSAIKLMQLGKANLPEEAGDGDFSEETT